MNGFEAALLDKRQADQVLAVLSLWEGRERDWESGVTASASTKDRMLDVVDVLNVKLAGDVIDRLADDLFEVESEGRTPTVCAVFAIKSVREYQDSVNA